MKTNIFKRMLATLMAVLMAFLAPLGMLVGLQKMQTRGWNNYRFMLGQMLTDEEMDALVDDLANFYSFFGIRGNALNKPPYKSFAPPSNYETPDNMETERFRLYPLTELAEREVSFNGLFVGGDISKKDAKLGKFCELKWYLVDMSDNPAATVSGGDVVSKTEPVSNGEVTTGHTDSSGVTESFEYHPTLKDKIIKETDKEGRVTSYTYDASGTKMTFPHLLSFSINKSGCD